MYTLQAYKSSFPKRGCLRSFRPSSNFKFKQIWGVFGTGSFFLKMTKSFVVINGSSLVVSLQRAELPMWHLVCYNTPYCSLIFFKNNNKKPVNISVSLVLNLFPPPLVSISIFCKWLVLFFVQYLHMLVAVHPNAVARYVTVLSCNLHDESSCSWP